MALEDAQPTATSNGYPQVFKVATAGAIGQEL